MRKKVIVLVSLLFVLVDMYAPHFIMILLRCFMLSVMFVM